MNSSRMRNRNAARVLDFNAVQPVSRTNGARRVIPHSPNTFRLASLRLSIPANLGPNKFVELNTTIGVRGVTGIAQVRFRIFRDGREIFRTQQGIESAVSERNYTVSFQAIDTNVPSGTHVYTLRVENLTAGTTAEVIGPFSFSALAISGRRRVRHRSSSSSGCGCGCGCHG